MKAFCVFFFQSIILLTKTTAAQNKDALSYHSMRGLYFQAVIFVATIVATVTKLTPKYLCNVTDKYDYK